MKIQTERLTLRDLGEKDLTDLVEQANNLEISKYLSLVPHPYTESDGRWFVGHCEEESKKRPRENYELAITLKENDEFVGVIGLTSVDRFQGTSTLGYWLGEKSWRQGIMSEAVEGIIDYAFNTLKLKRINVEAYVENEGSIKIIERSGFKFEGTKRKGVRATSTGKWHDAHQYGLLREEWIKLPRNKKK